MSINSFSYFVIGCLKLSSHQFPEKTPSTESQESDNEKVFIDFFHAIFAHSSLQNSSSLVICESQFSSLATEQQDLGVDFNSSTVYTTAV